MSQNIPLYLEEASKLIRDAGGKLVLAHPNDPHGTSLAALTKVLAEQTEIVKEKMLPYIDGVECWHSRSTPETTNHYVAFRKRERVNHDWGQRLPPKTNPNGHSSDSRLGSEPIQIRRSLEVFCVFSC